jgi:hypothetical protein
MRCRVVVAILQPSLLTSELFGLVVIKKNTLPAIG